MSNDDEVLAEYDLSAWDAPPPPAGLADAVIDRMGGTDVGIAVPVEEHRTMPKRAWIIAGAAVAALLLALGVWSLIRSTHRAAPSSGGVLADKARTLELDTVHADLDPGADVRWRRDGDVWLVEQRAGRAAWRVDGDEKLVVVAGAGLASVEATGANLRVEVQMNAMDARVIGASALTAAAVALVTVVVYEGHVKVGRGVGQQTVVVAPGTTYSVKNEDEKGNLVGSAPVATAGSGRKVAILGLQLDGTYGPDAPVVTQVMGATLRAAAQTDGRFQLPLNADKELVDEKLLMNCENEAAPCMSAIGADLGVDLLVFGHIEQLGSGYRITAKLLDVGKKEIASSGQWGLGITEAEGKGLDKWGSAIYADLVGGNQTLCDADALKEQGMEHINMGQHAAALAKFEASLACKNDPYVLQLAYMEACSSSNSPKAKRYYKQLTPAQQQKFAQICIRMKVAYQDDFDFSGDNCDEVSCVLDNYDGACCKKFKKPAMPDGLDNAAIANGMAKIEDKALACGKPENAGAKVTMRVTVKPNGSVDTVLIEDETAPAGVSKPAPEVTRCMGDAITDAKFVATKKGGAFSYPFVFAAPRTPTPPANCDADALKEQAMTMINMGQHAAALNQLEQSLKCKRDPYLIQLAFMESCSSKNSAKAKFYYTQLTGAQQQKFAQLCIRSKTDYLSSRAAATPPKACDADALKEQGMENINMGQHAAALAKFEASLACKRDPAVAPLAFMEACNSANVRKAKEYFKLMTQAQRDRFEQICLRQNIDPKDYDDDPTAGFLELVSKPAGAKVLIDGHDTGLETPITGRTLPLAPGKHKVTLVVGGERFTYSVTLQAGQTVKMSKELQ